MALQIKQTVGKTKGYADVVFCFDCTGSMKNVIDNVKDHVNKFVEGLNADQSTMVDWRMRAIGYGDLEKGEAVQGGSDFVTDVEAFKAQVASITICNGGDRPESTLDAIVYAAKTSNWRHAQKIIAIFTDAPTKDLHTSTKSTFAINDLDSLKKDLTENHIKLFLWGAADPKYKALDVVPKSEIIELSDPHAELSSGANMSKLLEQMGKTVSSEAPSTVL